MSYITFPVNIETNGTSLLNRLDSMRDKHEMLMNLVGNADIAYNNVKTIKCFLWD